VEKEKFMHPAVVLGLGQNGLATVRALARKGIPVIGIDGNLKQPTARTRLCRKIHCKDFRGEGLLRCLLDLGRTLPAKGILFPSGDLSLELVSERRELLQEHFSFVLPDRELMHLILNKKDFYRFAERHGFLIPHTYFPQHEGEVEKLSSDIRFPCILKPFQPSAAWRQRFPDVKLFEVSSAQELMQSYRALRRVHPEFLIQEVIPGPDSALAFSLTYFDGERTRGMFTGRKLRQYPPFYGTSCMAESRWDPWIATETTRLLRTLGYRGYGSVEFKWDPRDERFKIIELTPRTWFPHGLSTACGLNLPYLMYCDILGLPVEEQHGFVEGMKWIHEERDLQSSLRMWRMDKLTVREWLTSYRGRRAYALAAWDDPGPFLAALRRLLRQPFSSLRRRPPQAQTDLLSPVTVHAGKDRQQRVSLAD
jgi:predicted ATP-grasp superfamily ATP-dependent carboligase